MPQIVRRKHFAAWGGVVLIVLSLLFISPIVPTSVGQAAAPCGPGAGCVYLPLVARSGLVTGDLSIKAVEVTQGIQTMANSVPLVAGRSAMLRIYAQGREALPVSGQVTVALAANPPGNGLNSEPVMITADLSTTASRDVYASSINVALPTTWLSGAYDLSITLDPLNQVAEIDEQNNTLSLRVTFVAVPNLSVMIVPIRYIHSDGHIYPAPTQDTISAWVKRLYPLSQVDVAWHTPLTYQGDMTQVVGFSELLSQLAKLKKDEGAPSSQVYYGLVPSQDGSSRWFFGGVVGIGYINSRVALGLDYGNAGLTAAHEIGHNMGRKHAPCGEVGGPDAAYPYESASIGEYGLDVSIGKLYSPAQNYDLMSYCSPRWISDYTYRALFDAQLRTASVLSLPPAADAQPEPILSVRAQLSGNAARLMPVYRAQGVPDLPASDSSYQIQLLGMDGAALVEKAVQAIEVAVDEPQARFEIQANLALPSAPISAVRLLKDGLPVAEVALAPALRTDSMLNNAQIPFADQMLRWTHAERPAIIRYSLDDGQTWNVLAMDVTGGQFDLSGLALGEHTRFDVQTALSD